MHELEHGKSQRRAVAIRLVPTFSDAPAITAASVDNGAMTAALFLKAARFMSLDCSKLDGP